MYIPTSTYLPALPTLTLAYTTCWAPRYSIAFFSPIRTIGIPKYIPAYLLIRTTLASAHAWGIGTTKKRRAGISSSRVPSPHMELQYIKGSSINKGRYKYLPMMQEYLRYRRSTVDFNPGLP
ncbi:hypothetical protein F5Y11DRAFT_216565 [Daldinia sp. FL1419]|nr:hypothetical protein F5Y11DRAFT_216565 [Daldinia sp. FL1419]